MAHYVGDVQPISISYRLQFLQALLIQDTMHFYKLQGFGQVTTYWDAKALPAMLNC